MRFGAARPPESGPNPSKRKAFQWIRRAEKPGPASFWVPICEIPGELFGFRWDRKPLRRISFEILPGKSFVWKISQHCSWRCLRAAPTRNTLGGTRKGGRGRAGAHADGSAAGDVGKRTRSSLLGGRLLLALLGRLLLRRLLGLLRHFAGLERRGLLGWLRWRGRAAWLRLATVLARNPNAQLARGHTEGRALACGRARG